MTAHVSIPARQTSVKPTLRDVALRAGVSAKTVSRVVNGEKYVAAETIERVKEAIDALGFRPNAAAQSLRLGSNLPSIGLVIEDLANPFYSAVARAVEEVARARGHMVIVGSSEEDPEDERQLVNNLLRRLVNGLILVPAGDDHRYLEQEIESGTPIVFLDRPPGHLKADVVLLDDVGGAKGAVEHLLDQGHKRIGLVGDAPSLYTARKRAEGYRRALTNRGIRHDAALERMGSHSVESAEQSATELLSLPKPVSAIFATNNRNCIGVLRAVQKAGVDAAIVGFDDFELADLLSTPVTVVSYNAAEMGTRAAELLFDRLEGSTRPPRRIRMATRVVPRGSGERTPRR